MIFSHAFFNANLIFYATGRNFLSQKEFSCPRLGHRLQINFYRKMYPLQKEIFFTGGNFLCRRKFHFQEEISFTRRAETLSTRFNHGLPKFRFSIWVYSYSLIGWISPSHPNLSKNYNQQPFSRYQSTFYPLKLK